MKKSLYKIEEEYQVLMVDIENAEGEITPEQEAELAINEKDREQKSIAYICVIKDKESYIAMLDEEIGRLTAIKKREQGTIARLKDNLLIAVKLFGDYAAGTFKVTTRKSVSVQIDSAEDLPAEYIVEKVSTAPDKKAIKTALSAGEEIEGASLSTNLNLAIK